MLGRALRAWRQGALNEHLVKNVLCQNALIARANTPALASIFKSRSNQAYSTSTGREPLNPRVQLRSLPDKNYGSSSSSSSDSDSSDSDEEDLEDAALAEVVEEEEETLKAHEALEDYYVNVALCRFFLGIDNPTEEDFKKITSDVILKELRYIAPSDLVKPKPQLEKPVKLPPQMRDDDGAGEEDETGGRPESLAFFSGQPIYFDTVQTFRTQIMELHAMEAQKAFQRERRPTRYDYKWLRLEAMEVKLQAPLKVKQYRDLIQMLSYMGEHKHGHHLHDFLRPYAASFVERKFKEEKPEKPVISENAIFFGYGRRKDSIAQCFVKKGTGKILVNGELFADYFPKLADRRNAVEPFLYTNTCGDFDVLVKTSGGGLTGQSGAIRLGVARALLKMDPAHKPVLRQEGLLTIDTREVEPKKPGQHKARKKYAWVKR
eukprot:Colp12_sorted_trinity150504_noHs@16844